MKYLLEGQCSKRLDFRLLCEDDFEWWKALFERKEVARFLGLDPNNSAQELCEKWFAKAFDRYANDTGGMNVLVDRELGLPVGQCGLLLQEVEGEERMEVGYSLHPDHWGQGYATEAAMKCRDFAFENNFRENLISQVHIENTPSAHVARRNGMTWEKRVKLDGGLTLNIFSIYRSQWLEMS